MTPSTEKHRFPLWIDLLLLLGLEVFLLIYFDARYMLYDTVVTGGDTASWYNVAHHLSNVLLSNGRITGWDMGNFCGYPNFNFYFLPPFLIAAIPSKLFGIPLTISLKWVIMSGIFLLPMTTYLGLRNMKYRFPAPIIGAAGALLFVFNEFHTMFGGNTLSTFAGEFCYMFAFALFVLFIGTFYRGVETETRIILNGILLGLIGLSHLFLFIPAMFLLIYAYLRGGRIKYILGVGVIAFICMAFWLLPLMAYRHPYTTPVYMIWGAFANLRYSMAGLLILVLTIGPRFALHMMKLNPSVKRYHEGLILILVFSGTFAVLYLLGNYLVLGNDIWMTGLEPFDFSKAPLGQVISRSLDPWIIPTSVILAILFCGLVFKSVQHRTFEFCRKIGAVCFTGMVFLCFLGFHRVIGKAVPDLVLRQILLNSVLMLVAYGIFSFGILFYLGFSNKFRNILENAAEQASSNKFYLWLALVFGCLVAYFSAHFLQVPDIRFLPPLGFGLVLLLLVDTLDPFIQRRKMAVKTAFGVTACYLAVIVVVFGSQRAFNWYRFNNKGYEMTSGFQEFDQANHYLRTAYDIEGLNPLNAPRVGYEKCDLYGKYGGDRAFESLQFFSGRQTLEGIHYASSISSRFMAFLQTEFSRDVKTPKPQILSKVNIEALPKHFNLYNLSQLVVATDTVKRALDRSESFHKEAEFGQLSIYRYKQNDGRYIDIPEFRPVLYKSERWVDDFFSWYKDADRTDVLLVPEKYVKDPKDREVFAGPTDDLFELDVFRNNLLDRSEIRIDSHLEHLRIRFFTNKIGLPHLIKVSYFPNWKVEGANGVYPASPHLMMVIPRKNTVTLTYKRSIWEIIGFLITCSGVLILLGIFVVNRLNGRNAICPDKVKVSWEQCWSSIERFAVRIRPFVFVVIVVIAMSLIIAGTVLRNKPVKTYIAGTRAYKQGTSFLKEGKSEHSAAHFKQAVNIMKPLIENRSQYDHRDVINCLLLTAMCYENLDEHDKAETWYRTLLREYPYSRYVAEGYVKIARITERRMRVRWKEGLIELEKGRYRSSRLQIKKSIDLMKVGLNAYLKALKDDPYSVWASYAIEDLEKEQKFLDHAKAVLGSVSEDKRDKVIFEPLMIELEKIRKEIIMMTGS